MTTRYDAIVVGARCAGSATAMLLSRRGHRVLLLDKDTFPSDMPMSTHFIHQRGVAHLARWGLKDQLVATGTAPVSHGRIDLGAVTLSAAPPAVDGETTAFAPRRTLLDDLLVRAAVDSGAELRSNCRVRELADEDGRIVGVKAESASGKSFVEHARIVIGADGPASRVAARAGAKEYNGQPVLQGTAWGYWQDCPLDAMEIHIGEYEGVYAFPTSDGATLVGVNWAAARFRAVRGDLEAGYFDVLRRLAPPLAEQLADARPAEQPLRVGATRNFLREGCGPGWALVGDAHYKKDPCTAQGITDAFADAEDLAPAIDEGLSGRRDLDDAIAAQQRATVARALPFYELTCQMARFAPPTAEQLALYRALDGNTPATRAFTGLITTAVSPAHFFAPDSVARIMAGGAP